MFSHRFKVWCAKTIPVKFVWVPSDDLRCCPWIKAGNQDTIICFHKNNDVLKKHRESNSNCLFGWGHFFLRLLAMAAIHGYQSRSATPGHQCDWKKTLIPWGYVFASAKVAVSFRCFRERFCSAHCFSMLFVHGKHLQGGALPVIHGL